MRLLGSRAGARRQPGSPRADHTAQSDAAPVGPEIYLRSHEPVDPTPRAPIAGLDVMQAHIADLGVTLPKLDPDVREQTRGGHEGPPWAGIRREATPVGLDKQQVSPLRHNRPGLG
jgi:hypothetical protein